MSEMPTMDLRLAVMTDEQRRRFLEQQEYEKDREQRSADRAWARERWLDIAAPFWLRGDPLSAPTQQEYVNRDLLRW